MSRLFVALVALALAPSHWLIQPLSLSFRPVEIAALGGGVAFTSVVLWSGNTSRARGIALLAAYAVVAAAFYASGNR